MELNFEKSGGLIPAIVQHAHTRAVLMLGYMNEEALAQTRASGKVTFWSRSKQRLWTKGESSGNFLLLHAIHADCDQDALLVLAEPVGAVCHTGSADCFNVGHTSDGFIHGLDALIAQRAKDMPEGSYTTHLFQKGTQKVAQKVGEEAVELILEAQAGSDERFLSEAADLMYHYLVLLRARGFSLKDVERVLASRG